VKVVSIIWQKCCDVDSLKPFFSSTQQFVSHRCNFLPSCGKVSTSFVDILKCYKTKLSLLTDVIGIRLESHCYARVCRNHYRVTTVQWKLLVLIGYSLCSTSGYTFTEYSTYNIEGNGFTKSISTPITGIKLQNAQFNNGQWMHMREGVIRRDSSKANPPLYRF